MLRLMFQKQIAGLFVYLFILFAAVIIEQGKSMECSGLLGWVRAPHLKEGEMPAGLWWGSEPCWGGPLLPQQAALE